MKLFLLTRHKASALTFESKWLPLVSLQSCPISSPILFFCQHVEFSCGSIISYCGMKVLPSTLWWCLNTRMILTSLKNSKLWLFSFMGKFVRAVWYVGDLIGYPIIIYIIPCIIISSQPATCSLLSNSSMMFKPCTWHVNKYILLWIEKKQVC